MTLAQPPYATLGAGDMSETAEGRSLLARARALASEGSAEAAGGEAGTELLICRLHDERYAIELALLRAVQPARGLRPLPCTPDFVAGMLNVRGTVVTVLDLARGLGLPAAPPSEGDSVLLADAAGGGEQVGLLVQEVLGVRRLTLGDLDRAFSGDPAVRGVAEAGLIVLDLAALLADGRFEVAGD